MKIHSALLCCGLALAVSGRPAPASSDDPARAVAVAAAGLLDSTYVFPSKGAAAAVVLRRNAMAGAYDDETGEALATRLSSDLGMLHDKHVRVSYSDDVLPPASATGSDLSPAEVAEFAAFERRFGYGVGRVAHLPDNVGYIDIRLFASTTPQRDRVIDAVADAVAYSDTVILDLRRNHGGDPDAVARLLSHFLPPKTHLNDFVGRGDDTAKISSSTYTGKTGGPLITAPLYVLTSSETFSGGEECAYDLQTQKRATLIGEITGGGANPGEFHRIADHFSIFVPDGRARNPITHTNWDGVGVTPDIAVPRDLALRTAYGAILEREASNASASQDVRDDARELITKLRSMDDGAILGL